MQVNVHNYSNTFKSRNQVIREADDFARFISRAIPLLSDSKLAGLRAFDKCPDKLDNLISKINIARKSRGKMICQLDYKPVERLKKYFKSLKETKVGNCAESTEVSALFSYFANIKEYSAAALKNMAGEDLDHEVLYIENKGKPYIIDAWLGFADYVPNVINKYKTVYRNYFPFDASSSEKLLFRTIKYNSVIDLLNKLNWIERINLKKEVIKLLDR